MFCICSDGSIVEENDFVIKNNLLIANTRCYQRWYSSILGANSRLFYVIDGDKVIDVYDCKIENGVLVSKGRCYKHYFFNKEDAQEYLESRMFKWVAFHNLPMPVRMPSDKITDGSSFGNKKEAIDFIIHYGWEKVIWFCSPDQKPCKLRSKYIDYELCSAGDVPLNKRFLFNTEYAAQQAWIKVNNIFKG